jgi:hypothetical protein
MTSVASDLVSDLHSVPAPHPRVPDDSTTTRAADAVLRALQQLPDTALHGLRDTTAGRILFADAAQADALIQMAERSVDATEALRLADDAYRIDPRTPASGDSALVMRALVHWQAGEEAATRAWLLHDNAHDYAEAGQWKAAAQQFHAAGMLDPVFAWSLNDAAWMAATSADPGAHDADFAVAMAVAACQARLWGNWSMLDTLAAAYARGGDFARAVSWQEVALRLCRIQEPDEIAGTQRKLDRLRAGHAIVADDAPVAASAPRLAALDRVARMLARPFDTTQEVMDVVARVEDAGLFHDSGRPLRWSLDMFLGNFDDATARRILDRLADPQVDGAVCYRKIDAGGQPTGPAAAMFFGTELPLTEAQPAIDFEIRGPDGERLAPIGVYRQLRHVAAAPTSPSLH